MTGDMGRRSGSIVRMRCRHRTLVVAATALGCWIVSSGIRPQAIKPRDLRAVGIANWDHRPARDIARGRDDPTDTDTPPPTPPGWQALAEGCNMTLFTEACVTTDETRTLITFGTDPSWLTLTALAKDDAAGWFAVEWSSEWNPKNTSVAAGAEDGAARPDELVPPPAVLIRNAEDNPNHCLQDIMFALLPMLHGSSEFRPQQSVLPTPDLTFVLTHEHGQTYCHQLLDLLGWFKNATPAQPEPVCHQELLVPPYRANRFPRGRQDDRDSTFKLLSRGQSIVEPMMAEVSATDLPLEQLTWLRDKLVAELELELDRSQATSAAAAAANVEPGYTLLVNITREDHSRTWVNVGEAAKQLPGRVRVLNSLSDMSLTEQAWLFRNAGVVIGSHGDWAANAMFMRPGTALVEIECRQDNPDYLLAQQEMRKLCAPEPDVASFVDAKGLACSAWTGIECTNAVGAKRWYRPSEMSSIRDNCQGTCGPEYSKQRPPHGLMGVSLPPLRKFKLARFGISPMDIVAILLDRLA